MRNLNTCMRIALSKAGLFQVGSFISGNVPKGEKKMDMTKLNALSTETLVALCQSVHSALRARGEPIPGFGTVVEPPALPPPAPFVPFTRESAWDKAIKLGVHPGDYVQFQARGRTVKIQIDKINPKSWGGVEVDEYGIRSRMKWRVGPEFCTKYVPPKMGSEPLKLDIGKQSRPEIATPLTAGAGSW